MPQPLWPPRKSRLLALAPSISLSLSISLSPEMLSPAPLQKPSQFLIVQARNLILKTDARNLIPPRLSVLGYEQRAACLTRVPPALCVAMPATEFLRGEACALSGDPPSVLPAICLCQSVKSVQSVSPDKTVTDRTQTRLPCCLQCSSVSESSHFSQVTNPVSRISRVTYSVKMPATELL